MQIDSKKNITDCNDMILYDLPRRLKKIITDLKYEKNHSYEDAVM